MDRILIESGAIPAPTAAAPIATPPGTGTQAAPPNAAPVAAGVPPIDQGTGAPAATPPAQADQSQAPQYSAEQIAYLQAQARMGGQLMSELQQLAAYQAAQQEEQTRLSKRQEAINNAELTAQNLPVEEGIKYVARATAQAYEAELAAERQRNQQTINQQRQSFEQMVTPLYAQELGKKHDLRPEYVQRLATLPSGHAMDLMLDQIKAEQQTVVRMEQELASLRSQMDQSNRSQTAQQFANSGIHQPSGVGSQPSAGSPGGPAKGTTEHLLSIAGRMFNYAPGNQNPGS